ncbi:MAG: hypothetical protein Ct9H300mP11_12220 [Chloroflexota bacterium]|nr:MAG: hypothetical protein Ct9H300mP11_12220 [Chloroflexota bacterium]
MNDGYEAGLNTASSFHFFGSKSETVLPSGTLPMRVVAFVENRAASASVVLPDPGVAEESHVSQVFCIHFWHRSLSLW